MTQPSDHTIAERVRAEPSADATTAGWAAFWDNSDTMPSERVVRAVIAAYRAMLLAGNMERCKQRAPASECPHCKDYVGKCPYCHRSRPPLASTMPAAGMMPSRSGHDEGAHSARAEKALEEAAAVDAALHGIGFMKDGKRIDPRDVYLPAQPAKELEPDLAAARAEIERLNSLAGVAAQLASDRLTERNRFLLKENATLRAQVAAAREEGRREGAEAIESVNLGIARGSYRAGYKAGLEKAAEYVETFGPRLQFCSENLRALADKEPTEDPRTSGNDGRHIPGAPSNKVDMCEDQGDLAAARAETERWKKAMYNAVLRQATKKHQERDRANRLANENATLRAQVDAAREALEDGRINRCMDILTGNLASLTAQPADKEPT